MNQLQSTVNRVTEKLGLFGVLGLGLIVFSAGLYFSTISPEQLRLAWLKDELAKMDRKLPQTLSDDPRYSRDALSEFYDFFPPSDNMADQVKKIYAAAERHSLKLEQGEYRAIRDPGGRLMRYQLMLPLKGNYTHVRQFVATILVDVPNLSLESIQFERQRVGDSTVEAKVKLVMYLRQRS